MSASGQTEKNYIRLESFLQKRLYKRVYTVLLRAKPRYAALTSIKSGAVNVSESLQNNINMLSLSSPRYVYYQEKLLRIFASSMVVVQIKQWVEKRNSRENYSADFFAAYSRSN